MAAPIEEPPLSFIGLWLACAEVMYGIQPRLRAAARAA